MNEPLQRVLRKLKRRLVLALRPRGKLAFLAGLPAGARVLDVGCGNHSPREFKELRPDFHYTGLDVADYNQQAPHAFADEYILTPPAHFAQEIERFAGHMDAVVSSHNLEHCDEPDAVLAAMLRAVAAGGRIYLAFPCEESVRFPRRKGTLNFHDDDTHKVVPDWQGILLRLRQEGLTTDFASKRYRPWLLAAAGALLEPLAALTRRNMPGGVGWALYGFESVIWASRPHQAGATTAARSP